MAIVWPSDLPQRPDSGTWVMTPQENRHSFKPEVGPAIVRPRATAMTFYFPNVRFSQVTDAQRHRFIDFYTFDTMGGVLPFTFMDPTDGRHWIYRFHADDNPPFNITSRSGHCGVHDITCSFVRLPQAMTL